MFRGIWGISDTYQNQAACTLEFIQREVVGISPETGSKICCWNVRQIKAWNEPKCMNTATKTNGL